MIRSLAFAPMSYLASLSLVTLAATVATTAQASPVLVPAPVETVFVPLGFDDNDNVEVVVHGHFPNSCWRTGPIKATVDEGAKTVTVDAKAYKYDGAEECAQVLVPFFQVARLGPIGSGRYKVVVKDQSPRTTELDIAVATTDAPDDFLYAPVEQASLVKGPDGRRQVVLQGNYPYAFIGCMVMREVRTYIAPGNVLVVQPIAEMVDGPECDAQRDSKAFVVTKAIDERLEASEYLLHVRTLSGGALNQVIDLAG